MEGNEREATVIRILDEVLSEIESQSDEEIEIGKTEGHDRVTFRYRGEAGVLVFAFYPIGLVEWLLNQHPQALDDIYSSKAEVKGGEKVGLLSDLKPQSEEDIKEHAETYARMATRAFILGLYNKMALSLEELCAETLLMVHAQSQAITVRALSEIGLTVTNCDFKQSELKALLADMTAEMESYLTASLENFTNKPQTSKMKKHYEELLPVWKKAKTLYRQNRDRPTWREIIRASYPDVTFPEDLLIRLPGSFDALPSWLQARINEQDTDSRPSHLALEHAARICGARPYQFGRAQLFRLKDEHQEKNSTVNDSDEIH
jgi:hypothetical protein